MTAPKKAKTEDYMNSVIKLTDLMTNLIGTQREIIKLISTWGRVTMGINTQVDVLTKIVIGKDQTKIIKE